MALVTQASEGVHADLKSVEATSSKSMVTSGPSGTSTEQNEHDRAGRLNYARVEAATRIRNLNIIITNGEVKIQGLEAAATVNKQTRDHLFRSNEDHKEKIELLQKQLDKTQGILETKRRLCKNADVILRTVADAVVEAGEGMIELPGGRKLSSTDLTLQAQRQDDSS